MTDLERTLPAQLSTLADELAPALDLVGQAWAARSRYRHQQRTRAGLAAVAVVVAAIAVGVPTAVGSFSSAPATGGTTATVPTTSAVAPDLESEATARARLEALAAARAAASADATTGGPTSAAESAAMAEAQSGLAETRARAEMADATGRLTAPIALVAPASFGSCPDGASALSRDLGVTVTYWRGQLPGGPAGCQWATSPDGPPADRLAVGIGFLTGTPAAELVHDIAFGEASRCTAASVPAVDEQAELQRCTDGDVTQWYLTVPDMTGTGLWVLNATVGDRFGGASGGNGLTQVAALATATWGG